MSTRRGFLAGVTAGVTAGAALAAFGVSIPAPAVAEPVLRYGRTKLGELELVWQHVGGGWWAMHIYLPGGEMAYAQAMHESGSGHAVFCEDAEGRKGIYTCEQQEGSWRPGASTFRPFLVVA